MCQFCGHRAALSQEVGRAQKGGIHLGMRPLVHPSSLRIQTIPSLPGPCISPSPHHPSIRPSIDPQNDEEEFFAETSDCFPTKEFFVCGVGVAAVAAVAGGAQRADRPFPGILAHPPRGRRGTHARSWLRGSPHSLTHSLCSIRKGNFPFPNHHARMTDGRRD